ncbi:MAG TPA: long-chain fatty acid--CoA ligase [Ktedonobacterales bacterium]|nr:long-chain fatty acid--CoA ligase [Ktedonobacterales bacterium]
MSWFRRSPKPSDESASQPTPGATAPQSPTTVAPQQPVAAPPVTFTPAPAFAATMMDYPLTLQHVYNRGRRLFSKVEILTSTGDGYERSTFGETFARVERLAAALDGLGVRRGDRVATLAWNSTRHYELYFAVPCMGAVLHTLNLRLAPHQAGYIIKDAADSVIFVDADLFPLLLGVKDALGSVKSIVVMNGPMPENTEGLPPVLDYEQLLASAPETYQWPELDEREPAAMCYTSGTTGNPKGVVYSHRSTYLHAFSVTQADTIGLSNHDIAFPLVPMFHVNAWGLPHAAAMVGAKLVFPGRFMDPAHTAQTIADQRVTLAAGVPTLWIGLLQVLAQRPDLDLSSVQRVVVGGSAAPASLIAAMDAKGLPLLHAWGMTETSPIGTVARLKASLAHLPVEEQLAYRAKQGIPVTGIDLRIMNLDTGAEAPWDGETFGEIQVRGPWVTASYYHGDDMEQGASKFMDGWFRTGDVATIDPEGYIQIVDRTKDVIKSGGEWISSVQMEGIIMGMPQVLEAAVIGMPHPKWQERPVAVVVPKPEFKDTLTKDDIVRYLEPQVAKWWLPDEVVFIDALPKTSVGKFDKKVMRTQLADEVHLGEE